MLENELTLNKIYNKSTELYQSKNGYRFNSDSMILSWFVNRICSAFGPENTALEIGAGSGIVSIVLKRRGFLPKIDCIEIQESLCGILEKNIERNSLSGEISAVHADFADFAKARRKKYDLVFVNPPYFAKESGHLSADSEKALAKHEVAGSLADFFEISKNILRKGGKFIVIFPASRLQFALFSAAKSGYTLKNIAFFRENSSTRPATFAASFVLGTETAFFSLSDAEIFELRSENGEYSEVGTEIMYENQSE
ncbi:methyltransferase [bacterium]|nr:methyltransferase [bacterium]